ncbi:MAG: TatD family hydrolase [Cytophagaceae bacterium]|jgi:TatD DNase family protein|nr:TatD family hydrolase [Cytophagaceae bacterium]
MNYIDIHTHKLLHNGEALSVFNHRLKCFDKSEIFNGFYSIGLHPWDIESENDTGLTDETADDKNLCFIGECGFDKNIAAPYQVQEKIFISHVEMSEKMQKPLMIHCVGYFNEIINLSKQLQHAQKWIVHGFTGHPQLALHLLAAGFMLSFGKALFNASGKAVAAFCAIPAGTFFLETDDCEYSIRDIYKRAGVLRGIGEQSLKTEIMNNFKNLYL